MFLCRYRIVVIASFGPPLSLNRLHIDLRPAAVRKPQFASTPSSLVAANIVHNLALIDHCPHINQSNRPSHHAHSMTGSISHSPVNRDLLDDGLTRSLLLSPTMIRPNLSPSPKFPASPSDLVPFLCAVVLPSFLPPSLVLSAEDGSTDSKVLGEQQPTTVRGKKREWIMRSQSSYYGYEGCHRSAAVIAQTSLHEHPVVFKNVIRCVSIALGPYSSSSTWSLTVHFAHTRPHSPTTLAYESIIRKPTRSYGK